MLANVSQKVFSIIDDTEMTTEVYKLIKVIECDKNLFDANSDVKTYTEIEDKQQEVI